MTTLRNSSEIAAELLSGQGVKDLTLMLGQRVQHLVAWGIDRAREEDRQRQANFTVKSEPEVAYATATDWEVSNLVDEAGLWIYLQVYWPGSEEDAAPAVNVSMSDVEAHDMVDAILASISDARSRDRDTITSRKE